MSAEQKKLIEQVLSGAVTPATHRRLFDDDVVYFAVRELESADFRWLAAEVKKATSDQCRQQVLAILSDEHQAELG